MMTKKTVVNLIAQNYFNASYSEGETTGEGWYDEGSVAKISVEHLTVETPEKVRYILDSYILDREKVKIPLRESGIFTLEVEMDAPHTVLINQIPQY